MRKSLLVTLAVLCAFSTIYAELKGPDQVEPVPFQGTQKLLMPDKIAPVLVKQIDDFLINELENCIQKRKENFKPDHSSPNAYSNSLNPKREKLAKILGLIDHRMAFDSLELVANYNQCALISSNAGFKVLRIRWPALEGVFGEGLLLVPNKQNITANVIALPDADQTPEMLAGLKPGIEPKSQFARILAQNGFRVIIPTLINRDIYPYGKKTNFKTTQLPHREYIWRSAWITGRHIAGYELQKIFAAADWLNKNNRRPLAIAGYGEGARLALYAAALDTRFQTALVSGYFDSRQNAWKEPADRNVFGLLKEFGDAEIAAMITPRTLIIEASKAPELEINAPSATPGILTTPKLQSVKNEFKRTTSIAGIYANKTHLIETEAGAGPFAGKKAMNTFANALGGNKLNITAVLPKAIYDNGYAQKRMKRQIDEMDAFTQKKVRLSSLVRDEYFSKLDTKSLPNFEKTIEPYRDDLYQKVVGKWDYKLKTPNPKTRKTYESENWIGYQVVLDVFENVFATGFLLVPKKLDRSKQNPVIVCQHGLGGNPRGLFDNSSRAYHNFASVLADRGYIVFTPQNITIGPMKHDFRTLQRKSWLMGKTIFSIIVPQHQQIVNWLGSLEFVDPNQIAFYGLSYGGKTAMRVPALVKGYCLSICSGDFNEWIWKTANTDPTGYRFCYPWTGEYEIFEWNLANTFNYAEMAKLICPRPFMVERGHSDGVAPDERVAYEYAKVRRFYDELGITEKTEIEFFNGGHEIHLKGTYDFLVKYIGTP
jgi:dienelactone hydrolase